MHTFWPVLEFCYHQTSPPMPPSPPPAVRLLEPIRPAGTESRPSVYPLTQAWPRPSPGTPPRQTVRLLQSPSPSNASAQPVVACRPPAGRVASTRPRLLPCISTTPPRPPQAIKPFESMHPVGAACVVATFSSLAPSLDFCIAREYLNNLSASSSRPAPRRHTPSSRIKDTCTSSGLRLTFLCIARHRPNTSFASSSHPVSRRHTPSWFSVTTTLSSLAPAWTPASSPEPT